MRRGGPRAPEGSGAPEEAGGPAAALYLHVPFCVSRCRYCDFSTGAVLRGDPLVAAYLEALEALLRRLAASGLLAGVRTAYIGGGTPTVAGEGLAGLAGAVRSLCLSVEELTSEANPESLDAPLAARLAASGATRLSLGVQSLSDAELARLGRAHGSAEAGRAMEAACAAGLDLSCDLMCGIPLQTPASWALSLRGVLAGGAGHVSCYPLTVEEGTPLARAVEAGEERGPDEDLQADLMLEAERVLGAAGLSRYEVASYSLPGRECRHNECYWTGRPYLGLGTSAASMLGPEGFAALAEALPLRCSPLDPQRGPSGLWPEPSADGRELAGRLAAAGARAAGRVRLTMACGPRELVEAVGAAGPLPAEVEVLTRREALAEDLMLAMRMSAGAPAALCRRAAEELGEPFQRAARAAVRDGLARRGADGALAPTERGWLLGNELYGAMWGLASEDQLPEGEEPPALTPSSS